MTHKVPSYRTRPGYNKALVTLTDADTGKRRDYWLGPADSPESRQRYHQLLAEWEAGDRRLPDPPVDNTDPAAGVTVSEVLRPYWRWATATYSPSEISSIAQAARLLRAAAGTLPATAFGPKRLRLVRESMIRGDEHASPPRAPWSRPTINKQVQRICAIFKWAAGQELIPVSIYEQLKAVESLRRGRSEAREPAPVRPVADELVDAIEPHVSRQVRALVQLQRLTGARGGELLRLRAVDIDTSREVWTYTPLEHKTAHHGKGRTIYLGPRAQAVIQPFLVDRPVHAFLFSPTEADFERYDALHAQRQTPPHHGNRPGTNRRDDPQREKGDCYSRESYLRAITRACDEAFPPPPHLARRRVPARGRKADATRWESPAEWRKRLGPLHWSELTTWRKSHRWHPHQLRHAAGTRIRREFGLEAAQLALGHSSALITDAVYAERDATKVLEVMRRMG
ncbi:MAG: site-specific integrase [Phycisphaeraceae bacterium]|nr:site-specific integrase [Phycisphaeraceae bacterium]